MPSLKSIAGFVFRRSLIEAAGAVPLVGVKQAATWATGAVVGHFTSHATELTAALGSAHEAAWGALAFSLGDDSALDLLRGPDTRHLRQQMQTFLQNIAPGQHAGADETEFRHHCLEQLRSAKRAGLLEGGGIDMSELCRHVGSFAEIGNSAKLLAAERAALGAIAAEFPTNHYPQLRQLLELSPGNGEPFLIVAAEFFFKRQIATSESLARVVGYDLQITLLREQRDGQAQIILKMDQQTHELMEQLTLLRRDLRPQDGCSMQNETERGLVRALLKQFRNLPQQQQQALPDLLGDLGRLAFAAGEFKESRAASTDAAAMAVADPAKAQGHYNACLAALEDRDWTAALESLRRAIELDSARYMLFPFEKYAPVSILGAGGFGVAFLCDHIYLAGRVVVKTLQPSLLNRDLSEIFREATVLESLNHPGIVRIRDAAYGDIQRKRPYFVMDYFAGQSLDDHVMAHGPFSLPQALEMGRHLADALGAAHDRGILHRDVKPRNVLIAIKNGRVEVKLIDFGLALSQGATRTLATGHTLLGSSQAGTVDYAAPEQLGKLPGVKVDKYSDIYSWAKTLCFALFRTPNPRPRQFQTLPEPLQDLLDDSLAEHREEISKRPATMKAVLERLAACAAPARERAVIAPPASLPPARPVTVASVSPLEQARQTAAERLRRERESAEQQRRAAADAEFQGKEKEYRELKSKLADQISHCRWRDADATGAAMSALRPDDQEVIQAKAFISEQFRTTNSIGMEFVRIEPGSFMMGSPADEGEHQPNEILHKVTLTKPFMMGVTPVTQKQWLALMRNNPSKFKGDNRPIETVSYDDAAAFCKCLGGNEGRRYRLPTEAEWEYACRAGTTTAFNNGNGEGVLREAGWYFGNSGEQTHPVRQKKPNVWGLFDMHGNVWEWCSDFFGEYPPAAATDPSGPIQGTSRVVRGGSWFNHPVNGRSAHRNGNAPDNRNSNIGFRVVLDSP